MFSVRVLQVNYASGEQEEAKRWKKGFNGMFKGNLVILQLDPGGGANWKVGNLGTTRTPKETAPKSELRLRSYDQSKLKKNPRKRRRNQEIF